MTTLVTLVAKNFKIKIKIKGIIIGTTILVNTAVPKVR